jgi:hypothetical protein
LRHCRAKQRSNSKSANDAGRNLAIVRPRWTGRRNRGHRNCYKRRNRCRQSGHEIPLEWPRPELFLILRLKFVQTEASIYQNIFMF